MPVNDRPVEDATLLEIAKVQQSIIDDIYTLIFGATPMETTEQKLMPSSALIDLRDRLVESNGRLSRLNEHLKVLR